MHPALRRVLASTGIGTDAWHRLCALAPSELRPVELALYRARAERPLAGLRRAAAHVDFAASPVDLRTLHRLEGAALAALPSDTTALDLSPLVPLGLCRQLAGTPQDNVLSGTRGREVLGDPTVPMAVLAAARRRAGDAEVHLGARARAVRMQPLVEAHHTRHFLLFALASAGRAAPALGFRIRALLRHVRFYVDLLVALRDGGFGVGDVDVRVSDMAWIRAHVQQALGVDVFGMRQADAEAAVAAGGLTLDRAVPPRAGLSPALDRVCADVVPALADAHPDVPVTFDLGRLRQCGYFPGLCFHVRFTGFGAPVPLADGGFVDWSARLLDNRREHLLTSGIGLELLGHVAPA